MKSRQLKPSRGATKNMTDWKAQPKTAQALLDARVKEMSLMETGMSTERPSTDEAILPKPVLDVAGTASRE